MIEAFDPALFIQNDCAGRRQHAHGPAHLGTAGDINVHHPKRPAELGFDRLDRRVLRRATGGASGRGEDNHGRSPIRLRPKR